MHVSQPTIDHEVRAATERLVAAEKAMEDAREAHDVAQRQVDQAKREIANVFLQLYVKLPTDARNKVRHAINNYGAHPAGDNANEDT